MGDLVNVRRGTERADDVHPLQWWILSEAARRDAAAAWKIKSGEILRATNRRSIPRVPLENMPPSTTTIPTAMTAMVSKFLVSEHITTAPADIPATTSTSSQSVSLVSLYQEQDWTLPSGSLPSTNEVEDFPPELVDESSDEEWRENAEICSECSSADTDDNYQFLLQHYKEDRISERESSEDEVQPTKSERANEWCLPHLQCATCTLPRWTRGMDPRKHHCRNFCMHG